ncbi:hypothetical protein BGLA2_370024 [Burkholderia gladioli]|nr:hypothetical protein BGLA2_370024 [Burkholderia gladioli]
MLPCLARSRWSTGHAVDSLPQVRQSGVRLDTIEAVPEIAPIPRPCTRAGYGMAHGPPARSHRCRGVHHVRFTTALSRTNHADRRAHARAWPIPAGIDVGLRRVGGGRYQGRRADEKDPRADCLGYRDLEPMRRLYRFPYACLDQAAGDARGNRGSRRRGRLHGRRTVDDVRGPCVDRLRRALRLNFPFATVPDGPVPLHRPGGAG